MGVDFRTVLFGTFCSGLIPSGSDAAGIGIAGTFVVFDIIVVAGFFDQAGFIKGFSAGGTGGTAAYLSFRVAVDFAGTRTGTVFGVTDFAAFPGFRRSRRNNHSLHSYSRFRLSTVSRFCSFGIWTGIGCNRKHSRCHIVCRLNRHQGSAVQE